MCSSVNKIKQKNDEYHKQILEKDKLIADLKEQIDVN